MPIEFSDTIWRRPRVAGTNSDSRTRSNSGMATAPAASTASTPSFHGAPTAAQSRAWMA